MTRVKKSLFSLLCLFICTLCWLIIRIRTETFHLCVSERVKQKFKDIVTFFEGKIWCKAIVGGIVILKREEESNLRFNQKVIKKFSWFSSRFDCRLSFSKMKWKFYCSRFYQKVVQKSLKEWKPWLKVWPRKFATNGATFMKIFRKFFRYK